jgi:alpha-1,6-mannosyltransferase
MTPAGPPPATRTATLALLACGALLVAAYALLLTRPMWILTRPVSPHTHLVGTLGIDRGGALAYVAIVLVLFALYGLAAWLVLARRARPSPGLVLALAAAAYVVLLPTHPLTSTDLFNYIAGARVFWTHGANPLTVPPVAFADDPFVALVSNWRDLPSPYGPLWTWVAGVPLALGGGDPLRTVLAFKALSVVAFLAGAWLVYLIARRLRPDSAGTALLIYAWNPLAVFHVAGNGHNDAVMVLFVVAGLYCLTRGWTAAAVVALAASVLVKFASALLLPLIAVWWLRSKQRPRLPALVAGCGAAALLAVVAFAPFWEGAATLATTLGEGRYYTVSVPAAVRGALQRVFGPELGETLTGAATRIAFLAVLLLVLVRLRGDRVSRLAEAGFVTYFAWLTLAASYFAPWYVLWLLPFAALLPFRRDVLWPALTLTLTAMAVLVAAVWFRERFAPDPRADWYGMHLAAALAVFPLPVLVWLWAVRHPVPAVARRPAARRPRGAGQQDEGTATAEPGRAPFTGG